jgi:hypothetical protein
MSIASRVFKNRSRSRPKPLTDILYLLPLRFSWNYLSVLLRAGSRRWRLDNRFCSIARASLGQTRWSYPDLSASQVSTKAMAFSFFDINLTYLRIRARFRFCSSPLDSKRDHNMRYYEDTTD